MRTVTVRDLVFGEGRPKICVPVVARDLAALTVQAEELRSLDADLCEWRVDWYDGEDLEEAARTLRGYLPHMPLLFTFRTKAEGGEKELSGEGYAALCKKLMALKDCGIVDIELFTAGKDAAELTEIAHQAGKAVIFSSHDFQTTPPEDEIISRLSRMEELGGDLLKIAVMPNSPADVLTLLSATMKMRERSSRPLVTMSMGPMGAVSRACGETFGSCMTFGAAKTASAPGQIPVGDLKRMLELFALQKEEWVRVDAYLIPSSKAKEYIADREYYAQKAAEVFGEFCPDVRRDWAGSEDGEAVVACDEGGRLMMHVHLDPDNIREMKEADRKGELRRWLLTDYIKEE